MSRPPKPASVLRAEGRSHRTKAELEQREKGEAALLSGQKCFERESVKADSVAHKEYQRLVKLMRAIDKDDALYAPVYNRYCELFAEADYYKHKIARLRELAERLEEKFDELDDASSEDISDFAKALTNLLRQINSMDSAVMQKRKMMFDIEKENCMTVAAALRTIPKDADKSDNNDELMKILQED